TNQVIVSMYVSKCYAATHDLSDSNINGFKNVVDLDISKGLLPLSNQTVKQHPVVIVENQAETDLVEPDGIAEDRHQFLGFLDGVRVQRNDQALPNGNILVRQQRHVL